MKPANLKVTLRVKPGSYCSSWSVTMGQVWDRYGLPGTADEKHWETIPDTKTAGRK